MNQRRETGLCAYLGQVLIIGLPTLVYVAALLFDPSRTLVLWERTAPPALPLALLAISLTAHSVVTLIVLARLPDALSGRHMIGLCAYVFVAGVLLQTAATHIVEPFPLRGLAFRQYSDFTGGYFTVGVRVDDLGGWLARFAQEMESYNVHAERHPPGLPMIFWLGVQLLRPFPAIATALEPTLRPLACFDLRPGELDSVQIAAGLFGILVETLAAWSVPILLFAFVRRIADDRAAVTAALLYPLVPGALMWASQWDRSFGLFTLAVLLFVEVMLGAPPLSGRGFVAAFSAGLVLFLATLMSFGNLPIAMIGGLYAVVRIWQLKQLHLWLVWLARGALALAGLIGPWAALVLLAGFDLLGSYNTAMRLHLALERDYWPFVLWHPWDILTFAGLPLAVAALCFAWRRAPALALAWVGTLVVQSLLHVARGETGRVWMYFAPTIVALGSLWLTDRQGVVSSTRLVFVAGLLVAQATAHIGLLRVIGYGVDPITVPNPALPADLVPTEIRFEPNGEIRLIGYRLKPVFSPGETGVIDLYWRHDGNGSLPRARKVFIHVADTPEDHYRIVNQDGRPANWTLPTTCWQPGQVVHDRHVFTVAADALPGEYYVLIGLYDELTGERAFVHTAQLAIANAVALPTRLTVTSN
jgi:hypothetical protein